MAAIRGFCYEATRQDDWVTREDGTSYGTFIADLEVEGTDRVLYSVFDTNINHMVLELDPHCDGHGRIGTDKHSCQGVLGARFIDLEMKERSTEPSSLLVSETPGMTRMHSLTPSYSQYGLQGGKVGGWKFILGPTTPYGSYYQGPTSEKGCGQPHHSH